ncbi:hypothetical protein [Planomonospora algeriensis]
MRNKSAHEEWMWQRSWAEAAGLRGWLVNGGTLPEIPRPPLNVPPPVRFHAGFHLGYSRWYAADVSYTRSSVLALGSPAFVIGALAVNAIGNSVRRTRALELAAPQWREHQAVQVFLTNESIITSAWNRWQFWYFSDMMTVVPDFGTGSVLFTFSGNLVPLRLQGMASAWLFVATTYLMYGTEYLRNAPEFFSMGPADTQESIPARMQERAR